MNALRPMVSMELDDEDQLAASMPIPMPDKPEYPYGLKICLTEKEFEKLKLDPSAACVGGIFHLHALARITNVSMSQNNTDLGNDENIRVEAQIEDMSIESEDEENE